MASDQEVKPAKGAPANTGPNVQTGDRRVAMRLAKALDVGDRRMKYPRAQRYKQVTQFAGPSSGEDTVTKAEPLNMLHGLVQALMPALALEPNSLVTALDPQNEPFADLLMLALDKVMEETRLAETIERVVLDAFFGPGITFTGLAAGDMGPVDAAQGYLHDADEIFSEHVSLDAYIPDPYAKVREAYTFEAHRFWLDYEWAMDQRGLFNRTALEKLDPNLRDSDSRVEDITRRKEIDQERWVDEIELIRVWLPGQRRIVTLPGDLDMAETFLSDAESQGTEEGPYDVLAFMECPDNTMSVAPCGVVYDLHILTNTLMRKMKRQAERQKDLTVYDQAAESDASTIRQSNDGDVVGISSVDRVKHISTGGTNPEAYRIVAFVQEWFNRLSGNPDAIGGIEAQSKTLGQDQLLWSSASAKIGYWRMHILRMIRRVVTKMAFYLWTDPTRRMQLVQNIAGGIQLPRIWTPDNRRGALEDYHITAQPYGIQSDTPERKYARILQWFKEVGQPLAALGAPQGIEMDIIHMARVTAELADIPGADRIFTAAPPEPALAAAGGPAGDRNVTNISQGGRARPASPESGAQVVATESRESGAAVTQGANP